MDEKDEKINYFSLNLHFSYFKHFYKKNFIVLTYKRIYFFIHIIKKLKQKIINLIYLILD